MLSNEVKSKHWTLSCLQIAIKCIGTREELPYFVGKILRTLQVNLDMIDSMGPGKLVRHMQNPSYIYDEYLICIGLGPSISAFICKNPSYSAPSYPSSPVSVNFETCNFYFISYFKI